MKRLDRVARSLCMAAACLASPVLAQGAIFLTGHDSDFHAQTGGAGGTGAIHINQTAIACMQANNPYYPDAPLFLYVESTDTLPLGHLYGETGIAASGFISGVDYERHSAATLFTELAQLGTKYYAVVVASDYGGMLTQAELDILNANVAGIVSFVNCGGGIFVLPEGTGGLHLTTHDQYAFLPTVPVSLGCNGSEASITLTSYGTSLGLVATDVTLNAFHACFAQDYGLEVVDNTPLGEVVTLHGRLELPCPGVVPPPGMVGWWPLDEQAGTVAHDIQSGMDGTHQGSPLPSPTTGYVSNGLAFLPDNRVSVQDDPGFAVGTSDFTIDAWIQQDSLWLDNEVPVVSRGASIFNPMRGPGFEWGLAPGLTIGQYLVLNGGGLGSSFHWYVDVTQAVFDGQWHHIAVTAHRSGTPPLAVVFYLDGTAIPDMSGMPPVSASLTSADPLLFASSLIDTGVYRGGSNGVLDEVEIFNRALTAAEIQSLYDAGHAGKCKPDCSYLCDDDLEGNDDCASAVDVIPFVGYPDLYVAKIDEDWYRLTVPPRNKLKVRTLFSHSGGNIDMTLHDGCNGAVLRTGASLDDDEEFQWTNTSLFTTRFVFLRVYVHQDSLTDCNDYILEHEVIRRIRKR